MPYVVGALALLAACGAAGLTSGARAVPRDGAQSGSNVFNIFLGLGLPWLIYTAVWWTPYTSMQMQDPLALLEPIIILFVYIFLLLGVMLFSGWRLYPKVGYVLILLDLLFIAWSLLTHPLGGAGSTPVIAVNGR